ncbi:MAG: hypothetical protein K6F27_09215, partial [Ruminococcus sp.]|nr:hypothetical protein [Ruminococcus sp.]
FQDTVAALDLRRATLLVYHLFRSLSSLFRDIFCCPFLSDSLIILTHLPRIVKGFGKYFLVLSLCTTKAFMRRSNYLKFTTYLAFFAEKEYLRADCRNY